MKTDELAAMLATGVTPVDRHASTRRIGVALGVGATGALILMQLVFGVRPDLVQMAHVPLFWEKLAFPAALGFGALQVVARVSTPGRRAGVAWLVAAVPVAVVWLCAAAMIAGAPPSDRLSLVLGQTWRVCAVSIALLSVPAFIALQVAVRGLAPTAPRVAGAAAGLLAGAIATTAYSLHCPEMSVAFWAIWYVLGMTIPLAVGALWGPRLLRW
jgi:hypothetical protein